MDPISVSASILGLLGAAGKISEVLTNFVKGVRDAPALAHRVFTEVEDLALCFRGLQEFINSERSTTRSRQAMITVDRLLIMLTHCVLTFSELEAVLDGVKPRNSIFGNSRLRWVAKEQTISKLLQRLQCSKASLNLILTTLNWSDRFLSRNLPRVLDSLTILARSTRLQEAQQATDSLTTFVNDILASNQALCRRLENLNLSTTLKHQSAPSALESVATEDEDVSTIGADRSTYASNAATAVEESPSCHSSFEQDLRRSRVYTRASRSLQRRSDGGPFSLPSSAACSMGSSFFSGLSLADVSNISLISLPISVRALSNGHWYQKPLVTKQLQNLYPETSRPVPRQTGKVLLLGEFTCSADLISLGRSKLGLPNHASNRHLQCWKIYRPKATTHHAGREIDTCRNRRDSPHNLHRPAQCL